MYYVYILKSLKNGDLYVGSTTNIDNRIKLHNSGKIKSTKAYRLWILLETRKFNTRSEAIRIERFLKTGQQKEILKRKYKYGKASYPRG